MFFIKFIKLSVLLTCIYATDSTIFFVYNANDDFPSIVGDFFHKSLSPKTYPCQLCKLTYGAFAKKQQWKEFLSSISYKYEFIYKNNIEKLNYTDSEYPIILFGNKNEWNILVTKKELNNCQTIEQLINIINLKLEN